MSRGSFYTYPSSEDNDFSMQVEENASPLLPGFGIESTIYQPFVTEA
jgi:hypothetical protein